MYRGEMSMKKKVTIRTQNEKIVQTDIDVRYQTYKKHLLDSGRNSGCKQRDALSVIAF